MSNSERNFCFPIKPLVNSRLVLVPFDSVSHTEAFVHGTKSNPELFNYLPYGPFQTISEFQDHFYKPRIQKSNTEILYAILVTDSDKQAEVFAGTIGLLNCSPPNASLEIGFITLIPKFHHTYVASNAIGLLLMYVLDSTSDGGLGLRRCQWQSHADNEPSRRVAKKMHFTFEGIQRFQRVLPKDKIGNGVDIEDLLPEGFGRADLGPSRDSAVFAHYCDEWAVKKLKVIETMKQK